MGRTCHTSPDTHAPAGGDTASPKPSASPLPRRRKGHSVVPGVIHPHAGGIDVGAEHVWAAVPPDRTTEPVRRFGTFTDDLYELVAWLKQHHVNSVAMESTGVFWIPIFHLLEAAGIEVLLTNAKHAKHVPGRKSDVQDCQWLQYLHSVGLLRASFQPPAEIVRVRALMRHRANVVADGARAIQHMQKSLTQMNLHVHHVLSDLSGVSGLAIVDAILGGERDPVALAQHRQPGVRASEALVQKALVGDYRSEHLFTLQQARNAYAFCRTQLQECDERIEQELAALCSRVNPQETPPLAPTPPRKARKGQIELPHLDLQAELYRILGTDVTRAPGLGTSSVCALLAELGVDLKKSFASSHHFSSWMGLSPNPHVSGGKVLRPGTKDLKHRVATIFRLAAQTQARSENALGGFYRRMRAKLGAPAAVTATAHKLARIYYHLVTTREAYDESIFERAEEAHQKRRRKRVEREAKALGFTLATAA